MADEEWEALVLNQGRDEATTDDDGEEEEEEEKEDEHQIEHEEGSADEILIARTTPSHQPHPSKETSSQDTATKT